MDRDGNEVTSILSQPKRLALLVYLAAAKPGGLKRRDTLLGLFWPESDETKARNALSQSLSFLRRNLSDASIISRGTEEVGFAPFTIRTDLEDFDTAIAEERWGDALDLYGGGFMQGFHLGGAWGFGDWVDGERERLQEAAAGAAWALAKEQIGRGTLVDAERNAQKALALVWSDETPVADFIESMAKAGDRAAALRFYEKFREKLWDELEVEPSLTTAAIADAIRNGDLVPDVHPAGQGSDVTEGGPPPTPASVPTSQGPWKLWFWSLASAAIFSFAATGAYQAGWFSPPLGPPPSDRPFAILASVAGNAGGEERDAVGFLLQNRLDGSHVVQTVPVTVVERVLALMDRALDTPLTPGLAREVAQRLGVSTVVLPRLDLLGGDHVLALRVEDLEEGRLTAEGRGVADSKETVVAMVDEVARDIRRKLGEPRAVLADTEPLPQVLTSSLEALKKYQAARTFTSQVQVQGARTLLWEAVALDSAFAMAWQRLSDVYLTFPVDRDSSGYAAERVQEFRHRLTEARWADIQLHLRLMDDIALWDQAFEEAEEAIERDPTWSDYYALRLGHEGALPDSGWSIFMRSEGSGAQVARRFDPDHPYYSACHSNYLKWAVSLNRSEEWLTVLDSLGGKLPEDCARDLSFYETLAEGEWNRADSLLREHPDGWRWPNGVEWTSRQLHAIRGRVNEAHGLLSPAPGDPFGLTQSQRTRLSHLFLDLVFHLPHHEPGPGDTPMELEGRGKFPVVDFLLYGAREGLMGDTVDAKRVVARLQAMRDTATSRTFERNFGPWFTLLNAAPAFRRGDWGTVVEELEPMAASVRDPGVGGYLPGAAYLAWWLLAEAHTGLGDSSSAISCLEAFFPRPVHRLDDWAFHGFFRPSARLGLGRLYAEMGEGERARAHLHAFLDTFTDPDLEYEWMVEKAREILNSLDSPPTQR